MNRFSAVAEVISAFGVLGVFAFVPLTMMATGAILTFLGVYYPRFGHVETKQDGKAELKAGIVGLKFSGGLRFAMVVAGLTLLVLAVYQTGDAVLDVKKKSRRTVEDYFLKEGVERKIMEEEDKRAAPNGIIQKLLEENTRQ